MAAMSPHSALRWIVVPLLLCAAGCVTEPVHKTPTPVPGPLNDTPANTIQRFVWAYENKKAAEYENLFTEDFTFEFSTATDPELAQQYAAGWLKLDEKTSAHHLFEGFMDDSTGYHTAASSIALTFANSAPSGDTDNPDPTRFKVLATRVDGVITVPPTGGQTEDTHYVIDNNFLRFFLVRGDAAASLAAGQPADSTHWYIWKWRDETSGAYAPASLRAATQPSTWSKVKGLYR
jgi:hypothetical protein